MPLGLRLVKVSRWFRESWLTRDSDIPSNALFDLIEDKNNSISIWVIEDDKSNFKRVIAALAANRDNIVNIDYALFDINILTLLHIKYQEEDGGTPDQIVNQSFHLNLIELTARQAFVLAREIHKCGEPARINHKDVQQYIKDCLLAKFLDRSKINMNILDKIDTTV
jgi:hypothetical protein